MSRPSVIARDFEAVTFDLRYKMLFILDSFSIISISSSLILERSSKKKFPTRHVRMKLFSALFKINVVYLNCVKNYTLGKSFKMKKQEVLLSISCIIHFSCFNLSILLETSFLSACDFRIPATQKDTDIYRNTLHSTS